MHHVALDRAGPHDRHLDDEIVEAGRLQPRQHRHLRAALDLEHADRVRAREHLIDGRILGRHAGERQRAAFVSAVVRIDEVERLADAGEHAERQHIHLEHAERVDVVLVPLDVGAVLHGGVEHRHGLVEAAARQHEAADVLGEMAREADQRARQPDRLPQHRIGRIEPGFRDVLLGDLAVADAPDQPGKARRHVLLQPHRLADLADRHARAVVDDGGADGGALAAVAAVEILDHLLAPLVLEVDVDIGRLAPLRRDEALEQHVDAGGIDGGDAEADSTRRCWRPSRGPGTGSAVLCARAKRTMS